MTVFTKNHTVVSISNNKQEHTDKPKLQIQELLKRKKENQMILEDTQKRRTDKKFTDYIVFPEDSHNLPNPEIFFDKFISGFIQSSKTK